MHVKIFETNKHSYHYKIDIFINNEVKILYLKYSYKIGYRKFFLSWLATIPEEEMTDNVQSFIFWEYYMLKYKNPIECIRHILHIYPHTFESIQYIYEDGFIEFEHV